MVLRYDEKKFGHNFVQFACFDFQQKVFIFNERRNNQNVFEAFSSLFAENEQMVNIMKDGFVLIFYDPLALAIQRA